LSRSQRRDFVGCFFSAIDCRSNMCFVSYTIDKLPEGGEGLYGYDDGEEDD
jgi:hypothetical protein